MKTNFSLSGMPDFSPAEMHTRKHVISIIEAQFNTFGFSPITTSLIEKRSNLFDSYGEDGEKLIFQILRSGDYLQKVEKALDNLTSKTLSPLISDKSLRYDLTVPLTRYIAENRSSITFPFRRYEIGSVFRADRPQKGRLRQFTQCDADIIGSQSLWLEIDLLNLMGAIFNQLKLDGLVIRVSHRKVLEGVFKSFSSDLSFSKFCIIIDKLDKVGLDKVGELLKDAGLSNKDTCVIKELFLLHGSFLDKKKYISKLFSNTILNEGIDDLSFIFNKIESFEYDIPIKFDFSLARGLDYYTGCVFEVVSLDNNTGSLAGGGRYDSLAEKFNVKNMSGVGLSIGLDRLCLALEELNLLPTKINNSLDFLLINFSEHEADISYNYIIKLRSLGFSAELYPDKIKLNKQMSYAHKRGVKFVVMIGEEEVKQNKLTVKNMLSGTQDLVTFNELIKLI